MFGIMAVLLGSGDAFHLVPRALALCTTGLENFTVQLGLGKWITSVTMTIFYVVLYHIWRERYQIKGHNAATAAVYGLAGLRIILCMMPQNNWLSASAPLSWGIYRNIPFALMGILITVFFKFSVFLTLFTVDEHMPSYCYIKKFFLNNLFFHRIVTDHDCPDIFTCLRDHQHTDHRNDIRPQHNRDIECKA